MTANPTLSVLIVLASLSIPSLALGQFEGLSTFEDDVRSIARSLEEMNQRATNDRTDRAFSDQGFLDIDWTAPAQVNNLKLAFQVKRLTRSNSLLRSQLNQQKALVSRLKNSQNLGTDPAEGRPDPDRLELVFRLISEGKGDAGFQVLGEMYREWSDKQPKPQP